MKKLLVVAVIGVNAVLSSHGQNVTNLTSTTFFSSVQEYFSSFNTNYTFTNNLIEASTGYKQVTGVNAANFIDAQVDLPHEVTINGSVQFSGVGSALNGGEIGVGYNLVQHYDTELNLSILGGYDNTHLSARGELGAGEIEPGLTIKKKLSTNTFAEIGVSLPVFTSGKFNSEPTFRIGAGFTY